MNGDKEIFPVQLTMDRIDKLTRLICTQLFVMTTHAYIYTVGCTLNSRLLSGHLGFVAGTLRGSLFPVCYGSVGVQLTRLRRLNQGTLTSICVRKNLNATVLQVTFTREFFFNSCTGISKSEGENVSIQYSSSSTNVLYLNILYTNSGCGKNIWTPPWTSGAIP